MSHAIPHETTLAIDIGGTKILGALVSGRDIKSAFGFPTPQDDNPGEWLKTLFDHAPGWRGKYNRVGAAVTGVVEGGRWSALNPKTLSIPSQFPLEATLADLARAPATALNDAQAAAWGEYCFGAGRGTQNCVFLTISTGIGGGVVLGGKVLTGLAGHFGQWRLDIGDPLPIESRVAGRWMAETAIERGHRADAKGVFEAAANGKSWAIEITTVSAHRIASLCTNIQLGLDPDVIVIGGSIGLASGFIEQIETNFANVPQRQRPKLVAAQLGGEAGIVGIAQFATSLNT